MTKAEGAYGGRLFVPGAGEGRGRLRGPPPTVEPSEDFLFNSKDAKSAAKKGTQNKKTVIGTIIKESRVLYHPTTLPTC